LVTNINGIPIGPGSPCKFVKQGAGCKVYLAAPKDPCKIFQCHWKENTEIPEWLKPSKVNAILMFRILDNFNYIRIVKAGIRQDPKIYEWAEEQSQLGKNLIAYDQLGELLVYSKDKEFIKLAKAKL
jgi:hypothetical protein